MMETSLHGRPRGLLNLSANESHFLGIKCVCHFLGGQAISGSQSRSLIAFLDFTSPSDPKLDVFLPLIKKSCSWESGWLSAPKGLGSRAVEGYRPIHHHNHQQQPHPCLIKSPHFHDPDTSFLPGKTLLFPLSLEDGDDFRIMPLIWAAAEQ